MNDCKASVILNRIFSIVMFVLFGSLFIYILINGYENETDNNTYSCTGTEHIQIIITMLVLLAVFYVLYIFFFRKKEAPRLKRAQKKNEDKPAKIIIYSVVGAMLVLQLICGYILRMEPVTDLEILNGYALDFAKTGSFDLVHQNYRDGFIYMARYPNNVPILLILSVIYRLSYCLTGAVNMFLPVIINTIAINASVLLTVFTARKLFSSRASLFILALCFLFMPFYVYTPYYYTDSLSMPFMSGAVYLFASALKCDSKYKRYIFTALCGGLLLLGGKIKGSILIVMAVAAVYVVLKYGIKRVACLLLALFIGFSAVSAVYTPIADSSGIVTDKELEESQFPYSHWIMMGLKNLGHYNLADSNFTAQFPSKKEKQQANTEEIIKRIKELGFDGMPEHLYDKATWVWEDGTYYISHHIEKYVEESPIHSYVLTHGENHFPFYAYCCGFQLFLILMICVSAIKGIVKPDINLTVFIRGIVFGVLLFSVVWEARSRYLYNFTPLFLLLSADGLEFLTYPIRKRLKGFE